MLRAKSRKGCSKGRGKGGNRKGSGVKNLRDVQRVRAGGEGVSVHGLGAERGSITECTSLKSGQGFERRESVRGDPGKK